MLLVYCWDPGVLLGVLQPMRTSLAAHEGWGQETRVLRLVPSSQFYPPVQLQ